jgi:hypothetical protein
LLAYFLNFQPNRRGCSEPFDNAQGERNLVILEFERAFSTIPNPEGLELKGQKTSCLVLDLAANERHLHLNVFYFFTRYLIGIFREDRDIGELAGLQCSFPVFFETRESGGRGVHREGFIDGEAFLGTSTSPHRIRRDTQAEMSRSGSTGQYPGESEPPAMTTPC